jgi:hypothetical protein
MPHTERGFVQFTNAGQSSKALSRLGRGDSYFLHYENILTFILLALSDTSTEHISLIQRGRHVATVWHLKQSSYEGGRPFGGVHGEQQAHLEGHLFPFYCFSCREMPSSFCFPFTVSMPGLTSLEGSTDTEGKSSIQEQRVFQSALLKHPLSKRFGI